MTAQNGWFSSCPAAALAAPSTPAPPPGQYRRKPVARAELPEREIAHHLGVWEGSFSQGGSGQPRPLAEPLLDIRLNAARPLLGFPPPLAINVIAHRCGFADTSHFSR